MNIKIELACFLYVILQAMVVFVYDTSDIVFSKKFSKFILTIFAIVIIEKTKTSLQKFSLLIKTLPFRLNYRFTQMLFPQVVEEESG